MTLLGPAEAALFLTLGAALGSAYFLLLLHAVRLYTAEAKVVRLIPLYLLRIAAAVAIFWLIAQQGALALLLALLGFLAARFVIQYWTGSGS